jgi:diguanylate cyclase (GGDEF)-like protein
LHLIDLDGFKAVNDRYGHPTGDRLLNEVGRRLSGAMREGDLAVRLGGDEFCIIQTGLAKAADAEALGNRVLQILSEPFSDNGTILRVGASAGVALEDGSVCNIDALIEHADSALYRAKRSGGNTLKFWRVPAKLTLAA